jgi:hypothetical protein
VKPANIKLLETKRFRSTIDDEFAAETFAQEESLSALRGHRRPDEAVPESDFLRVSAITASTESSEVNREAADADLPTVEWRMNGPRLSENHPDCSSELEVNLEAEVFDSFGRNRDHLMTHVTNRMTDCEVDLGWRIVAGIESEVVVENLLPVGHVTIGSCYDGHDCRRMSEEGIEAGEVFGCFQSWHVPEIRQVCLVVGCWSDPSGQNVVVVVVGDY